ncbi:MAG: DUF1015 domain-containing protein [Actinomycetota bacterium]|nr:DUF1015 domain-containing protein [Actinomycetota bacterium]
MPRFEPFAGLRYSPSHISTLDDVVCPPYDVISESQREALVHRSSCNVVRLELPEGPDAYRGAAALLDAWRDGGVLFREHRAAFYGYRMSFRSPSGSARSSVGVIGALGLEPPGEGILPHEETTPKAKTDRLELLRAAKANLSPIWVLTPETGLAALCEPPVHPSSHATDERGVIHELWPITEPERVAAITELVGGGPVLVADGHHRYETALAYEVEAGAQPGDHHAVMALVVELAGEQLSVQAIHRLISDLPAGFDLLGALDPFFDLTPTAAPDSSIIGRMADAGALAVVTASGAWLARPRPAVSDAAVHDLDSSRLDVALATFPDVTVTFQHGWFDAAAEAIAGRAQAAVLLRPASVDQIAGVAQGGVRMPPKTTFFAPKPRTGMVIRDLLD